MDKTLLSPSTLLQGRYRIVRTLGHGGMGVVYQAVDENLQCTVAIKETFATEAEKEMRAAFEHEAHLLANVRHPAFPRVTDYFEQGDGLFFVMDFIEGRDLDERLKLMGRPLIVAEVLRWADRLLDALTELHAVDPPIVHKDIKPLNIKLCGGEVYLLDFGLAKGALGQMSTVRGQDYSHVQGYSPHFASPEQIAGTGTSPRSDLYSLGATLWCLLTNEMPPVSVLRNDAIHNGDPDPLRPTHQLNPEVTPAVSAVLERAMSLSRMRRPASAAEMRAALRDAVEAPLRARAERERREAEEEIRRRAEEEIRSEAEAAAREALEIHFNNQLTEERDSHTVELRRLGKEHRAELERVREELADARAELRSAQEKLAAQEEEALAERSTSAAALAAEESLRAKRDDAVGVLELQLNETRRALGHAERMLAREQADRAEQTRLAVVVETARISSMLEEMRADLEAAEGRAAKAQSELSHLSAISDIKTRSLETAEKKAARLADELQQAEEKVEREREATRAAESSLQRATGELQRVAGESAATTAERDEALERVRRLDAQRLEAESKRRTLRPATALFGVVLLTAGVAGWLAWAGRYAWPAETVGSFTAMFGGVRMEMVKVPGGSFLMGSSDTEAERWADEKPQHRVKVPGFYMGKYEVTQAQWRAVAKLPTVQIDLSEDPSTFKGDDLPVESVSWDEATEFCVRLSKATGLKYRLPTEAEWEYAARGGAAGAFTAASDPLEWSADNSGKQRLDATQAWNSVNQDITRYRNKLNDNECQTHPVGQKQSNAFGLYDTLGNVREWCLDTWHADYKGAPGDATVWTTGGDSTLHVQRGGSWFDRPVIVNPATRISGKSDSRSSTIGFRVVSVP